MKSKPVVLGVCGSIRSSYKHISKLKKCVDESIGSDELNKRIREIAHEYSNSDIAVAYALLGAKTNGAEIQFISINSVFSKKYVGIFGELEDGACYEEVEEIDSLHLDHGKVKNLIELIQASDGVILGTPVYFGDRSSVANKFLQLTNKRKLMQDRAFGVVSVGAKRNGGQETANIYSLYEGLMQNCVAVGNGPSLAQYGGTLVAGDKQAVLDDEFGLKTAFGTGHQVSQLSKILRLGRKNSTDNGVPLKLLVVMTMDTPKGKYCDIVRKYLKENVSADQLIELTFLQLIDQTIYRCVACDVCPSPRHRKRHQDEDLPYNCIVQIKSDAMKAIQEELNNSDAIMLVGVNSYDDDLVYRYQAFMERTRYIRREDFELSNRVVFGVMINEIGAINNPIHNIKVLTSFIRHNAFIIKPIEIICHNDKVIYQDDISTHIEIMHQIKRGRGRVDPLTIKYLASGYSNRELDVTSTVRR